MAANGEKGNDKPFHKDDKEHAKKMKNLGKDLIFFKLTMENKGREETLRHNEQIKGIKEEMVRELKSNVDRKVRENSNLQKALNRLEKMKADKEKETKKNEEVNKKKEDLTN